MKLRTFTTFLLALVSLIHIAVCFLFQLNTFYSEELGSFILQFYVTLAISCGASVGAILIRKTLLGIFFTVVAFLALLFIGMPMGEFVDIELALLINLVLLTVFMLPFYWNIILACLYSVSVVLTQNSIFAWGVNIPDMQMHNRLLLALVALISMVTASFFKRFSQKWLMQEQAMNQQNNTISLLTDSIIKYQQLAYQTEERTKVKECNRITHEIHDSIGYNLTTIMMMMEAAMQLSKKYSSDELKEVLELAKNQARLGLAETRQSLRMLRSVEFKREKGLKAVTKLVTEFELATGVNITVEYSNVPLVLGEKIDKDIYRFVQEGITNSFRHGKATSIKISFWKRTNDIIITIQDNGKGCKEIEEGIGLAGMRERLEELDGALTISTDQGGFTLTARIPFQEKV